MKRQKSVIFWTIRIAAFLIFLPIQALGSTITYQYDAAGRLTGADYGAGKSIAYTYDNNGNLLTRKVAVSTTQYVSSDGTCGGNSPCHLSVQDAINGSETGAVIMIAEGTYRESIALNEPKSLILQGGWDASFKTQTSNKTFITAPKPSQGSITVQMATIKDL